MPRSRQFWHGFSFDGSAFFETTNMSRRKSPLSQTSPARPQAAQSGESEGLIKASYSFARSSKLNSLEAGIERKLFIHILRTVYEPSTVLISVIFQDNPWRCEKTYKFMVSLRRSLDNSVKIEATTSRTRTLVLRCNETTARAVHWTRCCGARRFATASPLSEIIGSSACSLICER